MLASNPMASDRLTRDDVLRVARLAKLELTDADVALFTRQLAGILEYAETVQKVDTTGVPPTSHAAVETIWREDEPRPSLDRSDSLRNAPDASPDGLFKVPKVL